MTGASGLLGSKLAFRLAAEGAPQRLVVRDEERAPSLGDGPLPESDVAVVGGYSDTRAMVEAFTGCDTVFLVSARESADRVAEHRAAVDAAVAAGVQRVVYLSFVGAAPDAVFTFARDHWHTEQYVRGTRLRHTFLRDNLYHRGLALMVGDDGVLRGPAGDGRVASVSHDDIADVATAVLLDERPRRHDGATYDLTGPEALTLREVAEALSGGRRPRDHLPPGDGRRGVRVPGVVRRPALRGRGLGVVLRGDRRGRARARQRRRRAVHRAPRAVVRGVARRLPGGVGAPAPLTVPARPPPGRVLPARNSVVGPRVRTYRRRTREGR